ncbi:hypothetical protein [Deinococcus sp. QL22]|uniref:hypothetical protein n=1 Tax=Deinococcus sp. QL22 TaxID=2939437 RepID=UPI0020182641|nr:hypothetical protein [Deinococcus sp. QL22]UQN06490.1 hypothetical protein M1R55_00805 [Deinococcus sp. QL22]
MKKNRAARRALKTPRQSVAPSGQPRPQPELSAGRTEDHTLALALQGAAFASTMTGGPTLQALQSLLCSGPEGSRDNARVVLALAQQTLPGTFDLPGRLQRAAREVECAVALAQRASPNVLDSWALALAKRTVARATAHLFSDIDLLVLAQGAKQPEPDLVRVRQALLLHGDVLHEVNAATQRALGEARRAFSRVVSNGPEGTYALPHPEVEERDRRFYQVPDLNLRLGLVLLGQPQPISMDEVHDWFVQHRPGLLHHGIKMASAMDALGEEPITCCSRVNDLLAEALRTGGAVLVSRSVRVRRSAVADLAVRLVQLR